MTQLYAKVENGIVVQSPRQLPRNTKQVSGFHMLPPAELLKHGWYPVEGAAPNLAAWEHLGGRTLTVDEGRKVVTQSWAVQSRTMDQAKAAKIRDLKAECEAAILLVAPAFKQRNAALGFLAAGEAASLKTAISDLLARCDAAEAQVVAATTHADVSAVVW